MSRDTSGHFRRAPHASETVLLLELLVPTAVVISVAVAGLAVVSRRRTLAAWRQRVAVLARDVRLVRDRGSDVARPAAASTSRTVLALAADRLRLGLLPSPDRRRRRQQVAVDRAADELLARLGRMAREVDPEGMPPTGWEPRDDRDPRHAPRD